MVSYLKKVALLAGLLLIAVGSYAAYTNYNELKITESKLMTFGVGQTKAWIISSPSVTAALMTDSNASIHVTQEELVRYPTLKAYINYVDSSPDMNLNSTSIDPSEARSLLLFISQRSGNDVKPQPDNSVGEWYIFLIERSGQYYGINIVFSNKKPSLDSGGVGIGSAHARSIVSLTWGDITNRTSALNQGIHGYVLARLTNPTDPLVIHVNGTTKATVELWFVSYDWPEVMATNVTVRPQVSYGGGDWYNFTALSEPNGNMTLRVNEPTVINVTLTVPKGGSTGVGLGGNYRATLVDVKSNYGFLDSSCNIYEGKPILSVQSSNVTDEDSKIKIFNPGPGNVEFGLPFNTEKMVNGSWTPVEDHTIWILPLVMMGAGSDWSQRMNTTGLDSGLYRISKEITYNGQKQTFYAEFNFTRPA